MDRQTELSERVFTTKEKKDHIAATRATIKESSRKDEKVDLLELPKVVVVNTAKMKRDASPKQLAFLDRLGFDVRNRHYTMYDASLLISQQPASKAQVMRLSMFGYDISRGVLLGEAQKAFQESKERTELKVKKRLGVIDDDRPDHIKRIIG